MKLIVVSNRLPVTPKITENNDIIFNESVGGLATAIKSLNQDFEWFGWSGLNEVEESIEEKLIEKMKEKNMHPIFLKEEDFDNYYNGYSNSTIWPLFHYLVDKVQYSPSYWKAYKKINKQFAINIYNQIKNYDDPYIWIHDYQLMYLPKYLREFGFNGKIGFFLHIPFPSSEIFRICPNSKKILISLSNCNLIAFHTDHYSMHFIESIKRTLDPVFFNQREYSFGSIKKIKVDTYPIGIDYKHFLNELESEKTKKNIERLSSVFNETKIILSVDRLDYTKGLLEKLDAYEKFLEEYENSFKNVVLYQIVVPSRTGVDTYQELLKKIEEKVSDINGKYTKFGEHPPIYFIYNSLPFDQLCALYYQTDLMLITAIRDGMNLVSFEFCICQKNKKEKGVLLLSEFTGAVDYLSGAMICNPNDNQKLSKLIYECLTMSVNEKNIRNNFNNKFIEFNTNKYWSKKILGDLINIDDEDIKNVWDNKEYIFDKIKNAKNLFIFSDFDGTLVKLENNPQLVKLTENTKNQLTSLTKYANVSIISGREKKDLNKLIDIKNINYYGNHGVVNDDDEQITNYYEWKNKLKSILEHIVELLPGSFLEDKKYSIAFHYRNVKEEFMKNKVSYIINRISVLVESYDLRIINGNKVIEIVSVKKNKSNAIRHVLKNSENITEENSCLIAIGDDTTDEDMFKYLINDNTITIRVGEKFKTTANYYLDNQEEVIKFLEFVNNSLSKKSNLLQDNNLSQQELQLQ